MQVIARRGLERVFYFRVEADFNVEHDGLEFVFHL